MSSLTATELKNLILSVFSPQEKDKNLALIVDVPDEQVTDNKKWLERRKLAFDWYKTLMSIKNELGMEKVNLLYYQNVHNNNADLPATAFVCESDPTNLTASTLLTNGKPFAFETVLAETQLIMAPTQFSATAPLKLLAKKHGFRAATMPGFSTEMIPSLKLDYEEINRRVMEIKKILDPAVALDIFMSTSENKFYEIHYDLRHRIAHASGGRFPESGTAGNLPSGECYIVPYEGEKGEESETAGILPVQFDEELVLYEIEQNVARKVISAGLNSAKEAQRLRIEPAYGNMAEIGFGVLTDFGVKPTGEILLDEKLGLHIAFGRSDHFGGNVGSADFSSPEKVVHIDRIYIPETQNKIDVNAVEIKYEANKKLILMENGDYTIF